MLLLLLAVFDAAATIAYVLLPCVWQPPSGQAP